MTARKAPAKKAPAKKAPAKKAPAKQITERQMVVNAYDDLRNRIIEATVRYGKENDSCNSGVIDFLSEVLDEDSLDVAKTVDSLLETELTFTVRIKTKMPRYGNSKVEDINLEVLDNYEFAECVLEMLGFNTSVDESYELEIS